MPEIAKQTVLVGLKCEIIQLMQCNPYGRRASISYVRILCREVSWLVASRAHQGLPSPQPFSSVAIEWSKQLTWLPFRLLELITIMLMLTPTRPCAR